MEKMGTLKKRGLKGDQKTYFGPHGDQKTYFGPHGDQSPQMGTNVGAVYRWSGEVYLVSALHPHPTLGSRGWGRSLGRERSRSRARRRR